MKKKKFFGKMNTYSELLQKYRLNKNLSQNQLAKELNVSCMTIHRWETNLGEPHYKERLRVESYINDNGTFLDPYELLCKEILNLQTKIDEFKDYLKRFHS